MKKVYFYKNVTTGSEMDCNDLGFMLYQLRTVRGIVFPTATLSDLKTYGKAHTMIKDSEGFTYEVIIEERDAE